MRIHLEDLAYQRAAVVDTLNGQVRNTFERANLFGINANVVDLTPAQLLENNRRVIAANGVPERDAQLAPDLDLCIEMETGTGKTWPTSGPPTSFTGPTASRNSSSRIPPSASAGTIRTSSPSPRSTSGTTTTASGRKSAAGCASVATRTANRHPRIQSLHAREVRISARRFCTRPGQVRIRERRGLATVHSGEGGDFARVWDRERILDEVLLKNGFMLDCALAPAFEFTENSVQVVSDGHRSALVCLDPSIEAATIDVLRNDKTRLFI